MKRCSEATGTPHTLIIAAAALRAADLTRAVRKFQSKENAVAKLFAKHIKLKEQIEYCKKSRIGIGIGTPERVLTLINEGTIASSNCPVYALKDGADLFVVVVCRCLEIGGLEADNNRCKLYRPEEERHIRDQGDAEKRNGFFV